MEEQKINNFNNPFFWFFIGLPIIIFNFFWYGVFSYFSSNLYSGFFFFIGTLFLSLFFLLSFLLLEKRAIFHWIIFILGIFLPWIIFSLTKTTNFFVLFFLSFFSSLFFFSGKKIFQKEMKNQIEIKPVEILKKPFRGTIFAIAILFSGAFYFIENFEKKENVAGVEKGFFVSALEEVVVFSEKISSGNSFADKLNLNLTIDEYIKQNLPPQNENLLGKKVQLPDGTLAVFDQKLAEEMQRISIENSRNQLATQFEQRFQGNEKLFQVIGMILDKKVNKFFFPLKQSFPMFEPFLFIRSISLFFVFIWFGNFFRWPIGKSVQWFLDFLVKKNFLKREVYLIEKEELYFK